MIPGITTPYFTFKSDTKHLCRVVDIHDGDTLTIVTKIYGDSFAKFKVRLEGIDTYELHDKSEMGKRAKERLFQLITSQPFIDNLHARKAMQAFLNDHPCYAHIQCGSFDKYGRLLGKIYICGEDKNDKCVQETLIMEGFGVAYDGKKKQLS